MTERLSNTDIWGPERGIAQPRVFLSIAIIIYLIVAFGPIPFYFVARAQSDEPAAWAGSTAFDQFLGPSLIYHGSAAACAFMLFRRNAKAVWASWMVVVWAALVQVSGLRGLLTGSSPHWPWIGVHAAWLATFVLLAIHIRKLHRRGVLM